MANNKIVDREALKAFRKKLDERYAKPNGYYPTMTVGLADNLTPYSEDSGAEQTNPFISNGTGTNNNTEIVTVGDYGLLQEKQGNSLAVNQLCRTNLTQIKQVNTSGTWSDNVYSLNGVDFTVDTTDRLKITANGTASADATLLLIVSSFGNAKYLALGCPSGGSGSTYHIYVSAGNDDTGNGSITNYTNITNRSVGVRVRNGTTISNKVFYPIFSNLTQMFNGDIPQDLLDNPEHFSWYYNGSLAYNTGSLENANGVKLVSTKRNIWDEELEQGALSGGQPTVSGQRCRSKNFTLVSGNTKLYFFKEDNTTYRVHYVYFYDVNKNFIIESALGGNGIVVTPPNCRYFKFTGYNYINPGASVVTTDFNKITISLYYTPEQGGEGYNQYYPYEQPYVVDTGSEVLRKAGSVKDYKEPNGTIHRLVGFVDLGSLEWSYSSSNQRFSATLPAKAGGPAKTGQSWVFKNVIISNQYNNDGSGNDKTFFIYKDNNNDNIIYVYDSAYNDTVAFTNAMSDVMLNYELATETTEQGTPFIENLPINDYGMLYWLDSSNNLVSIPQGAKIFYPTNYKGFVDDMYSRVEGDSSAYVIDSELSGKFETYLKSLSNYDATATQVLKNVEGTLTWVTEE